MNTSYGHFTMWTSLQTTMPFSLSARVIYRPRCQ